MHAANGANFGRTPKFGKTPKAAARTLHIFGVHQNLAQPYGSSQNCTNFWHTPKFGATPEAEASQFWRTPKFGTTPKAAARTLPMFGLRQNLAQPLKQQPELYKLLAFAIY